MARCVQRVLGVLCALKTKRLVLVARQNIPDRLALQMQSRSLLRIRPSQRNELHSPTRRHLIIATPTHSGSPSASRVPSPSSVAPAGCQPLAHTRPSVDSSPLSLRLSSSSVVSLDRPTLWYVNRSSRPHIPLAVAAVVFADGCEWLLLCACVCIQGRRTKKVCPLTACTAVPSLLSQ